MRYGTATNRIGMMEEDRFACEKAFIARQREAGELAAQMGARCGGAQSTQRARAQLRAP